MANLSTRFAGLALRSPIIAASAPPTESVDAIRRCADAGVGAVVTKSIVDYRRSDWVHVPRRALRHPNGQWSIQGSFASETLTLREGLEIFDGLAGRCEVPVIASVGASVDNEHSTAATCQQFQNAGADMIHLDLFYMPHPRATDAAIASLVRMLRAVRSACTIPVTVKLNLDLPAQLVAPHLEPSLVDGVFLLDSVRVPTPSDENGDCAIPFLSDAQECSLFGSWQKPLTLQYTRLMADGTSLPICAGGGFQNANDILEALALGATTVQFATQLMIHGAPWVAKTTEALHTALDDRGFDGIDSFVAAVRGRAQRVEREVPAKAVINAEQCIDCGVCTKLMFCSHISQSTGELPRIGEDCYGCGFCAPLCPTAPRAIQLVAHGVAQ